MNTTEKRKLEGVITSKLKEARTKYQNRRQRELGAIHEELEDNPPAEVEKLAAKRIQVEAKYKKDIAEIEEKAEALGYEVDTDYQGDKLIRLHHTYDDGERVYSAPKYRDHVAQTNASLAKIDDLSTQYAITIWSESGEMNELLENFNEDIAKLIK